MSHTLRLALTVVVDSILLGLRGLVAVVYYEVIANLPVLVTLGSAIV